MLWGIYKMHDTRSALTMMVADMAPADLRGTAYGFFQPDEWDSHADRRRHSRLAGGSPRCILHFGRRNRTPHLLISWGSLAHLHQKRGAVVAAGAGWAALGIAGGWHLLGPLASTPD